MYDWTTTLRLTPHRAQLLVTDPLTGDRLKAVLPPNPNHPRALLTLLEGLALWQGKTVFAVISAEESVDRSLFRSLLGDGPVDSALVRWVEVEAARRRQVLLGLGDFRAVRRAGRCA